MKISSSSDEYHAIKELMTSHHSSDEEHEVSDYEFAYTPSYDELLRAFNELHDGFLKIPITFSKQKKTILNLESEANITKWS